jgi:hypothetical protein
MMISRQMRDVLIDHLDGCGVPIVRTSVVSSGLHNFEIAARFNTTNALLLRRFIRPDKKINPTHTFITEAGRKYLAMALADWAEALIRAGYDGDPPAPPASLRWKPKEAEKCPV